MKLTPPADPSRRGLLVLENTVGHKPPKLVNWPFMYGVAPLYALVVDSWLNLAESVQRVLEHRALGTISIEGASVGLSPESKRSTDVGA